MVNPYQVDRDPSGGTTKKQAGQGYHGRSVE
jgi:hypothetical protein